MSMSMKTKLAAIVPPSPQRERAGERRAVLLTIEVAFSTDLNSIKVCSSILAILTSELQCLRSAVMCLD